MLAHEPSFNIMDSEILGFLDFLPFSLPAAKKEITFFPTLFCTLKCSPMAVVWFLHASSHRYHPDCKSDFIIFDTFPPFITLLLFLFCFLVTGIQLFECVAACLGNFQCPKRIVNVYDVLVSIISNFQRQTFQFITLYWKCNYF